MGLDASQEFSPAPHKVDALAQKRAQRALVGRINIRGRNQIGAKQVGEFFGIDAVVFIFASVDSSHIEGMSQHEGEVGGLAGVGQPVPTEHAFGADGEVMAIGLDQFEEEVEVVIFDIGVSEFLTLAIHDADVHLPGVEIDSAVVLSSGGVILHLFDVPSGTG